MPTHAVQSPLKFLKKAFWQLWHVMGVVVLSHVWQLLNMVEHAKHWLAELEKYKLFAHEVQVEASVHIEQFGIKVLQD